MATTTLDATASIFYLFNQFIDYLAEDEDLPAFDFVVVTSIESAAAIIDTDADKLVLLQKLLDNKDRFTEIEYHIIPSFASKKDLNAWLTAKVFSHFISKYPRYTSMDIYESTGLNSSPPQFVPTGSKLTITKEEQTIIGSGQLRNNFNSLKVTFMGYLV